MSWDPHQNYRTYFYQIYRRILYTVFTNVYFMHCSLWHKISNSPYLSTPCQSGHWLIFLFMNRNIEISILNEGSVDSTFGLPSARSSGSKYESQASPGSCPFKLVGIHCQKTLPIPFATASGSEHTPTVSWHGSPDKMQSPRSLS